MRRSLLCDRHLDTVLWNRPNTTTPDTLTTTTVRPVKRLDITIAEDTL